MVETTEFPNLMLALPTQKKPAAEGVALPPSDSEVEEGESEDDPEVTKKPASAMKSASVKKSAVLKKPASATSKQAWVPTIGCKMNVRALALSCGGWVGCEGGGCAGGVGGWVSFGGVCFDARCPGGLPV